MKNLAGFKNYMDTGKNYGTNSLMFWDWAGNRFWFSYQTLVAFQPVGRPIVCHENDWRQTTGRHLNAIEPDHKARLSAAEFQKRYAEAFPEA